MTATETHLDSLDAQIATIRAAFDAEKKALTEHIMTLETELAIRTKLHDDAIRSKDAAMRTTAKLLTQFGIVATVFEEAKQLAMNAGLYTNGTSTKEALDKVDAAARTTLTAISSDVLGAGVGEITPLAQNQLGGAQ